MRIQESIFRNKKTLASYDPFTFIINLSSIDEGIFNKIDFENIESEQNVKHFSVFVHELTHWHDHSSTLWGHNNLLLLFNALNARAMSKSEELWRVKKYHNSISSEREFSFYTSMENKIRGDRNNRWKLRLTCGFRYDYYGKINKSNPLIFAKFSSKNDIPIARFPLTLASILESRATRNEFSCRIAFNGKIHDLVERNTAIRNTNIEFFNLMYDPELILYNVIFHLTANKNGNSSLQSTVDIVQNISNIVLNLTTKEFNRIKSPELITSDLESGFKSNHDHGYAYYSLLENSVNAYGPNNYQTKEILKASNLGTKEELEKNVIIGMSENIDKLIDGPFKQIAIKKLSEGMELFSVNGINNEIAGSVSDINKVANPNIMYGDTLLPEAANSHQKILQKLNVNKSIDFNEYYFLLENFKDKFQEFVDCCRE